MKKVHFYISGKVQGVFFRESSLRKAKELGIKGYVKNLYDERVEVLAEGEEDEINEFIRFCKNNPGHSEVKDIKIIEESKIKKPGFGNFEIKY